MICKKNKNVYETFWKHLVFVNSFNSSHQTIHLLLSAGERGGDGGVVEVSNNK